MARLGEAVAAYCSVGVVAIHEDLEEAVGLIGAYRPEVSAATLEKDTGWQPGLEREVAEMEGDNNNHAAVAGEMSWVH